MEEALDLVSLAAMIVSAYVGKNTIAVADLPGLLREVHGTLLSVTRTGGASPNSATPAVSVRKSVAHDHVVCLICGKVFKSLKRHLGSSHELTPDAYRARFNLPAGHPIVAPQYAAARSKLALEMGLGRKSARTRGAKRGLSRT
jgi:predicted transcriptional regulator